MTDVFKSKFMREVILLAVGLCLFIIFQVSIEHFLDASLITYVFQYIERKWYVDLAFFILSFGFVIYFAWNSKRIRVNHFRIKYWLLVAIIYLLYRFQLLEMTSWEFMATYYFSIIKYSDFLLIFFSLSLLTLIPPKAKSFDASSLFNDQPILKENIDDEVLGYKKYAEIVSARIRESNFEKSFAIGVNGKWGIGKSTFINCIKNNLNDDNILEFDFNPWNSPSATTVIDDFFKVLREKLSGENYRISSLLRTYSKRLLGLKYSGLLANTLSFLNINQDDPIDKIYDEINQELSLINKKLVVYIDDMDRLDKTEIIEVLRLIRNTASFRNTFFIVAYDREYVLGALEKLNSIDTAFYLEKIFQLEISLPYFRKHVLREKLADNLKKFLPTHLHNEINEIIVGDPSSVPVYLDEWLVHMRDVSRLSNAMIINFTRLIGNVVLSEFLRMELLRIKFPKVYNILFTNHKQYFEEAKETIIGRPKSFILAKTPDSESIKDGRYSKLYKYLVNDKDTLKLTSKDIERIVDLLNVLFSENFVHPTGIRSSLSITYPSKFERYFALSLLKGDLDEIEFSLARDNDQEFFNKQISKWVHDGIEVELAQKFIEIDQFDNFEDFKKIVFAILYFANLPKRDESTLTSFSQIHFHNKLIVMGKAMDQESKLFEFKDFLKDALRYKKPGLNYEISFLEHLSSNGYIQNSYFDENDLTELTLEYLEKNCESADKWSNDIWFYYNACKINRIIDEANHVEEEYIPMEARKLIRNFILNKDFTGFLIRVISNHPKEIHLFKIHHTALEIFEVESKLEQAIKESKNLEASFQTEYLDFFQKYKAIGFKGFIPFDFKHISVLTK